MYSITYSVCHSKSYVKRRLKALELADKKEMLNDWNIYDRYNLYRNMPVDDYFYRQKSCGRIDILSKIIQIDESKFGRTTYNRARYWQTLGNKDDWKWFWRFPSCRISSKFRDTETLIPFIKKQVQGIEIHNEKKAYNAFSKKWIHSYSSKQEDEIHT